MSAAAISFVDRSISKGAVIKDSSTLTLEPVAQRQPKGDGPLHSVSFAVICQCVVLVSYQQDNLVASMSHGAAATRWEPLKTKGNILQQTATWIEV